MYMLLVVKPWSHKQISFSMDHNSTIVSLYLCICILMDTRRIITLERLGVEVTHYTVDWPCDSKVWVYITRLGKLKSCEEPSHHDRHYFLVHRSQFCPFSTNRGSICGPSTIFGHSQGLLTGFCGEMWTESGKLCLKTRCERRIGVQSPLEDWLVVHNNIYVIFSVNCVHDVMLMNTCA